MLNISRTLTLAHWERWAQNQNLAAGAVTDPRQAR
jgi:hypothetical protein